MHPLILFIFAILVAIIHLVVSQRAFTAARAVEMLLSYIIPLNIGIGSLIIFFDYVFYGPHSDKVSSWVEGSPCQAQLSIAYLALGIAGLISIWWRQGFWIATTIISGFFIFGIAYVHFLEISEARLGTLPSGMLLHTGDLLIPAIYLILAYFYSASHKFFRPSKRR